MPLRPPAGFISANYDPLKNHGTGGYFNIIDYITIASTGNATDFGDLYTNQTFYLSACSDSHGGL